MFNECRRTGKSVAVTDQMLPIVRHGFMEETFYTWSCESSRCPISVGPMLYYGV
jgi:hypothetical protein